MQKRMTLLVAGVFLVVAVPAYALPVLVSQAPWGTNEDVVNFNAVFGAGNYSFYASFAAATPGSIFTAANHFVMLEGGDGTDITWANYVNSNAATILSWVSDGGSLLLQSSSLACRALAPRR